MVVELQPPGAAPRADSSARQAPPAPFKRLRRWAAVAWGGWVLSVGLLWGQHLLRVLRPWSVLFLLLLVVTLLGVSCGLVHALWRVLRGPRRRGAAAWGLVCLLPACFWAALGAYVLHLAGSGTTPKNVRTRLAGMAIASLMGLQARSLCPHRMETERLVMFYDERVAEPSRDLEAMERHVAQLEAMLGQPLRAKIYWARGELLGQRRMAIVGLAIGSSRSPTDWETADHPDRLSEDRHELAHAVIHQLQPAGADAPTLLIEGWAESQAGMTSRKRAEWAKQSRALWRGRTGAAPTQSYLRELTGPAWYHRIDGPVYSVGGAFVEFLLRKFGPERFLRLYFACRPGKFEAECVAQLGVGLDALELEFWEEVDRLAGGPASAPRRPDRE
jgi:hypothetical protein